MSKLFSKLKIRGIEFPNRLVLSPLCMYSAKDGIANDWHFSHLSTFARARVGCIFAEATAVREEGKLHLIAWVCGMKIKKMLLNR